MKIGSDVFEIRNSYEILTNTAEWLIRKGKLKEAIAQYQLGENAT